VASLAPSEVIIPIILTLSNINVKIEIITLIIATTNIRRVITKILKSKIEIQLNIFSYLDSIDLTERLLRSIDSNSEIELSMSIILELFLVDISIIE
jgi:hypothetical protein